MIDSARAHMVKALNYWRQYHLETYVGLRYFGQAKAVDDNSSWLQGMVARKNQLSATHRRFSFPRFKKRTEGQFVYREFLACSPVTALLEVDLLGRLSSLRGFENRPRVFSYRWPSRVTEKRIFEYYWRGYVEKNEKVLDASSAFLDPVVLVADITAFYPSINHGLLERQIANAFDRSEISADERELLEGHLTRSIGTSAKGIPIGPPTSHVLANLALAELDASLTEKYGAAYHRYVDDFVIVCERAKSADVLADLKTLLGTLGHELNDEKTDFVSVSDWRLRSSLGTRPRENTLEELIATAALACALSPQRAVEFSQVCRDLNILLPDSRFSDRSRTPRGRRWLAALVSEGILSAIRAGNFGAKDFEARLTALKSSFDARAREKFGEPLATGPMAKRWQTQERKYLLGRLFYLTSIQGLASLVEYVQGNDEFLEHQALFTACTSGNIAALLQFPGPAVATFTAVAKKLGTLNSRADRLGSPTSANVAALSTMLIGGAIAPGDIELGEISAKDSRLLSISAHRGARRRTDWEIDYLDELAALQNQATRESTSDLLESRYDWEEDVALEALSISTHGNSLA